MTSLQPRPPYTDAEVATLYPPGLQLQLVQILMRHGERTPVSARFQNAGLPTFWPYCAAANHLKAAVLDPSSSNFTTLEWKRRLEAFGPNDEATVASGPKGQVDAICDMGMLTDRGRETTYWLGKRFRHLYVEQLGFLPPTINDANSLYLRTTPVPRALESVQQTFLGLYPASTRAPDFPPPTILTRAAPDETLFPNDSNCRRFAALSRAFAQRAADRWNDTDDMAYLTRLLGKYMPEEKPWVAVDSHPRLSGIMDTVNSTLAHGPETRLPREFYDKKAHSIIEKVAVEEWFTGYKESREYRMLGIGGLMADVVSRMVGSAERSTADGEYEVARNLEGSDIRKGRGATPIRFGISGCHDTTLAGVLSSLGAFDTPLWPPFTSHIAIEMFKKGDETTPVPLAETSPSLHGKPTIPPTESDADRRTSWFSNLVSWGRSPFKAQPGTPPPGIGRKPLSDMTPSEKEKLKGYYVRIRYNDEVVRVPGCKLPGNHLDGDDSFCTLTAFKAIVDKYTPKDWKSQCRTNVKGPAFPETPEPAGY